MAEIERGDINVTVRTALKVANGLGITLAGLFEELEHAP
jgi:transcriptional regulator with XRE-family HTH domain